MRYYEGSSSESSEGSDKTQQKSEHKPESTEHAHNEAHDELHKHYDQSNRQQRHNFATEANEAAERASHLPNTRIEGGMTGVMTSPDGKQEYTVVHGDIYGKDKQHVGTLNDDGTVTKDGQSTSNDVNSEFNGWKFKGTEDGKPRQFDAGNDMASGKLFVPGDDGKPVQYDVRMGMVIDHNTGEQMGTFKPPTENTDGTLVGGSVKMAGSNEEVPLTDLKGAVFDVRVMGSTGQDGRNIQGASLGPTETQADGSSKPGVGGLFNIQKARDDENKKVEIANEKESKHDERNYFSQGWNSLTGQRDAEKSEYNAQLGEQKAVNKILDNAVETGVFSDGSMSFVRESTDLTKLEGTDALRAQRDALDNRPHTLEDLPQDTSTINGIVKIPATSQMGQGVELSIRNGEILSADGTHSIGRIENAQGDMTIRNPQTGKDEKIGMKDLAGAVWTMEYPDANGNSQKVDWISMGEQGGIQSVRDLRLRSEDEVTYAKDFDKQADSDDSQKALDKTKERDEEFQNKLDKIVDQGFPNGFSANDYEYLMGGPQRHVRDKMFQEGESGSKPEDKKIEVPTISTPAEAQSVNGQLRLGSDSYQIRDGKLYQLTEHNDRTEVSKNPVGTLEPGYNVVLNGRTEPIALQDQNRVLMDITVGDDPERKHIIGMGQSRLASDGTPIQGGLVDVKELERQVGQVKEEADKGNKEYFDNRPWLTGGFASWGMGDRDGLLKDLSHTMDGEIELMNKEFDVAFKDGFTPGKMDNYTLDQRVGVAQQMMSDVRGTAGDNLEMAQGGQAVQKLTNDSVIIAATTVATAGVGTVVAGAVEGGELTVAGGMAVEAGADVAAGAGISAVGRAGTGDLSDNLASGAVLGGTMALGSVGGRMIGDLRGGQTAAREGLAAERAGLAMTADQEAALNTMVGKLVAKGYDGNKLKAAFYATKASEDFAQTIGLNVANGLQTGHWDGMSAQSLAIGTGALGAGRGLGSFAGNTSSSMFGESSVVSDVLANGTAAYATGAVSSMSAALTMERDRIGKELGIKPEYVSRDLLMSRVNWDNVANTMNESGTMAGLTAGGLTGAIRSGEAAESWMTNRSNPSLPGMQRASAEVPKEEPVAMASERGGVSADQLQLFDEGIAYETASTAPAANYNTMLNSWRNILSEEDFNATHHFLHHLTTTGVEQSIENAPSLQG